MKLTDLKPGMSGLDIVAEVVEKSEPIMKGGKRYAVATLEDDTGRIALNLWRQQVEQLCVGDLVMVPKSFVQEWRGILELSTWADIVVLNKRKGQPEKMP